eukprot:scaffold22634_cov123-Cylindrotheca_fusiformis.AAC.5
MRVSLAAIITTIASYPLLRVDGFQSTRQYPFTHTVIGGGRSHHASNKIQQTKNHRLNRLALRVNPSNQQFDVSKPVFDLLSLRSIRGDALIRYDATNQSEPIRIVLYGIYSMILLASPSLADALDYDAFNLPTTIGTTLGSIWFARLFIRECQRRSNQLNRIEKELNSQLLPIRLPASALADRRFTQPMTLKQLATTSRAVPIPPRIIALCGTTEKLKEALTSLRIYGKRLEQASVFVVCVPLEASSSFDTYGWMLEEEEQRQQSQAIPWLADAYKEEDWRAYFKDLAADMTTTTTTTTTSSSSNGDDASPSFLWFGLNSNGRSIGSGVNEIPMWLQLLGQHYRPITFLDDLEFMEATVTTTTSPKTSASSDASSSTLAAAVIEFYHALTRGNEEAMKAIFSATEADTASTSAVSSSPQVTEVIDAGGRLDSWKDCLADGARPEGMKISEPDMIVLSDTEAYTTVVESTSSSAADNDTIAGLDSSSSSSGTLLAVQQWTRSSSNESWKLALHQTIPWDASTKARGTLRCDCRGCVALTRTAPERRQTFGGLIG